MKRQAGLAAGPSLGTAPGRDINEIKPSDRVVPVIMRSIFITRITGREIISWEQDGREKAGKKAPRYDGRPCRRRREGKGLNYLIN